MYNIHFRTVKQFILQLLEFDKSAMTFIIKAANSINFCRWTYGWAIKRKSAPSLYEMVQLITFGFIKHDLTRIL